ncbi:MAG: hypothetical protein H6653_20130, partial [Ardenticatenaceae bacterium]|nr:hypothetical protein [Ardenticatenaceae bacterium]
MKQMISTKYGVSILVLMLLMLLAACTPTGDVSGSPAGNENVPGAVDDNQNSDDGANDNADDSNSNDDAN